jgi:hypothetical protein
MVEPVKPAAPAAPAASTGNNVPTTPAPPSPEQTTPTVQGRAPNPGGTTDNPKEDIPASAHAGPQTNLTSQAFEGPKAPDDPQPLANPGVAGGVKYPEPAYEPPPRSKTGASYQTTAPHYLAGDKYVEADTILTEGVNIEEGWLPSLQVIPLNDEAKAAFEKQHPADKPRSVEQSLDQMAARSQLPGQTKDFQR